MIAADWYGWSTYIVPMEQCVRWKSDDGQRVEQIRLNE